MSTDVLTTVKHICDRCGNSEERDAVSLQWYPKDWQCMELGQTGARLDLCGECNEELLVFLKEKNADYMELAVLKQQEVL